MVGTMAFGMAIVLGIYIHKIMGMDGVTAILVTMVMVTTAIAFTDTMEITLR